MLSYPTIPYINIDQSQSNFFTVPKAQNSIEALRPRGYVPKAPDTESTILFYDFPSYYELDKIPPQNCNKKCKFTIQSSEAPSADAIVVFSHDHILGRSNLDLIKRPGQTWVFFAVESPTYSFQTSLGHQKFQQHFNWTMTYRWDSDIFFGYIKTNKRSSPATNKEREIGLQEMREAFRKKSKMVAWMVSHCETDSRRERYVRELKKHIQVDVYGACGDLKCANWTVCDQKVAEDYKFYLSFENTLCKDYASEKLAKVLKQQQTIPIVRGGADYKALCPPNSVVNTADFPSAAALAKYLKQLANDEVC